jgi:hypothetical protein
MNYEKMLYLKVLFSSSFLLNTRCELCQAPCLTCTSLNNCLTCTNQLLLLNDQCVDKCPVDYYSHNKQCLRCNPVCGSCIGKRRFI